MKPVPPHCCHLPIPPVEPPGAAEGAADGAALPGAEPTGGAGAVPEGAAAEEAETVIVCTQGLLLLLPEPAGLLLSTGATALEEGAECAELLK